MSKTILYHNPRCSKSRQVQKMLEANRINFDVIDYLSTPPSEKDLLDILAMLKLPAHALLRVFEPEYRENQLDDEMLDDKQLIDVMVNLPGLIQRPIVVHGDKAMIGRPPEKIMELFQ